MSCGVKSKPSVPKGTELPSILAPYLDISSDETKSFELQQAELENLNDDIF
jgi:hypothetical protein